MAEWLMFLVRALAVKTTGRGRELPHRLRGPRPRHITSNGAFTSEIFRTYPKNRSCMMECARIRVIIRHSAAKSPCRMLPTWRGSHHNAAPAICWQRSAGPVGPYRRYSTQTTNARGLGTTNENTVLTKSHLDFANEILRFGQKLYILHPHDTGPHMRTHSLEAPGPA